jgi:hypothetical protein
MYTDTDSINGMGNKYKIDPNTIGAYHMIGDDSYEPQRTNNFQLWIYFPETNHYNDDTKLYTIDKDNPIDTDIAQNSLILSTVSVGSINTNVSPIEVNFGNTKVKYAGLPSVENSTVVYNDYIGKATERIIAAWYGQVFNPKDEKIGRASVYKKDALLIETAPDGSTGRAWQLKGCWPSSVTYGDYSYNDNSVRQVQMTLTYDIAIPLDN